MNQAIPEPVVPVRVVVCAANRLNGVVICGARHFDILMRGQIAAMAGDHEENRVAWRRAEQGFVDQWGQFMTRIEALQVAGDAGQLNYRRPKHTPLYHLTSEDIY